MIVLSSGNKYYSEDEHNATLAKVNTLVSELRNDFNIVATALLDEAIERDWCESYNDFVEDLNIKLKHMFLECTTKNYEVKVKIEETREQYVYVSVTATSVEDAEEQVSNMDYSTVADTANAWNWDINDYDFNVIRAELA